MKHEETGYIRILNQNNQPTWSTNMINMSMSQVKARELSMCNQEMSTHWSTHQTPRLLHFKFKLDPLKDPQRSRHFVDPAFWLMRFPLDDELDLNLKKWYKHHAQRQSREYIIQTIDMSNQTMYNNESIYARWSKQSWQISGWLC